jgi:hypothetical protein
MSLNRLLETKTGEESRVKGTEKRPFVCYLLYFLLMVLAFNAFYGGGAMILSPDGSMIGMEIGWIEGTPFKSYLIPGIMLLLFMGIVPAITLAGLIGKRRSVTMERLNMYPGKHWSWAVSLYTGIITIIWIIVQQLLTEYFILQPLICATGVLIIIMTLLPRVQEFYSAN